MHGNPGTLIDGGNGSSVHIAGITPGQLSADNVKVNGEAVSDDNFNLQSALGGVADGGLDALSGALGEDNASPDGAGLDQSTLDAKVGSAFDSENPQGGAPAAGADSGAEGSGISEDHASDEVFEDLVDNGGGD